MSTGRKPTESIHRLRLSPLYANVASSLFAVFLAMFGEQYVNWYPRNRGGSASDKSRDRQQQRGKLER